MIKEEPLQGAIAMCSLMDTMKSQVDDRYTDEKRQLIENKQYVTTRNMVGSTFCVTNVFLL